MDDNTPDSGESTLDSMVGEIEEGLQSELGPKEGEDDAPPEGETPDKPAAPAAAPAVSSPGSPAAAAPAGAAPRWWPASLPWDQAAPEVRQAVAAREGEIQQREETLHHHSIVADGVNKLVSPYAQVFRDYNVNPFDHIGMLLNTHAVLSFGSPEQKVAIIRNLIEETGLDPSGLASGAATPYNPDHQRLLNEVTSLKRQFGAVTNELHSGHVKELEGEIEKFSQDPENRYFADVLDDMIGSMQRNPNQTLQACYAAAVAGNPVTRAREVQRLADLRVAELQTEARNKVAKARRAAAANVTSTGRARRGDAGGDNWEADLDNIAAEIRARE